MFMFMCMFLFSKFLDFRLPVDFRCFVEAHQPVPRIRGCIRLALSWPNLDQADAMQCTANAHANANVHVNVNARVNVHVNAMQCTSIFIGLSVFVGFPT